MWAWDGTTSASLTLDCSVNGCTASKTFAASTINEEDYSGEQGKDPGTIFTAYVDTLFNRFSNEKDVKQHQWGKRGVHIEGSPSQHTLTCVNDNTTMTENCDMSVRTDIIAELTTCTQPAAYYCECSKCGEVSDTVTVRHGNILDHKYGDWIYDGDSLHIRTCLKCPDTQTQRCRYGAAACPSISVCSVCSGERYPAGHIYLMFDYDTSNAPDTVTATFKCSRSDCSNTTEGHTIELTETYEEISRTILPNGDIEIMYGAQFFMGRTYRFTYDYVQHEWGDVTHIDGSTPSAHSIKCRNDDETQTEECVMQTSDIAPTCTSNGYTVYTCPTCNFSYEVKIKQRLSHWYGEWLPAGDGTHSAKCRRRCKYVDTQDCTLVTLVVNAGAPDEMSLNVCPVCGGVDTGLALSMVSGARAKSVAGKLPRGELIVRRVSLGDNAVLLSVAWEFAGRLEKPEGAVRVYLPSSDIEGAAVTQINASAAGSEISAEYTEIDGKKYMTFDVDFDTVIEVEPVVFFRILTPGN